MLCIFSGLLFLIQIVQVFDLYFCPVLSPYYVRNPTVLAYEDFNVLRLFNIFKVSLFVKHAELSRLNVLSVDINFFSRKISALQNNNFK